MELNKASRDCLVTIQNRIYIAKQIKPLKLDQKWLEAFDHIMKSRDTEKYGAAFREMMNSIVEVATRHY